MNDDKSTIDDAQLIHTHPDEEDVAKQVNEEYADEESAAGHMTVAGSDEISDVDTIAGKNGDQVNFSELNSAQQTLNAEELHAKGEDEPDLDADDQD